jgi:hypothetical protein
MENMQQPTVIPALHKTCVNHVQENLWHFAENERGMPHDVHANHDKLCMALAGRKARVCSPYSGD